MDSQAAFPLSSCDCERSGTASRAALTGPAGPGIKPNRFCRLPSPDATEIKREKYTAHFVFIVKDHVRNDMIPVNPLGLTITYFREDEAFQ